MSSTEGGQGGDALDKVEGAPAREWRYDEDAGTGEGTGESERVATAGAVRRGVIRAGVEPPRRATWSPGREPALILLGLLAPAVQTFLLVFLNLDPTTQAVWNAAAIAVAGLGTAWLVAREKLAASIIGVGGAVLSLLVHYGWDLSTEQQTALAAFLALAVGAYTRTQVTASVNPVGGRPYHPGGVVDRAAA